MNINFANLWEDYDTDNGFNIILVANEVTIFGFGFDNSGITIAIFGFAIALNF